MKASILVLFSMVQPIFSQTHYRCTLRPAAKNENCNAAMIGKRSYFDTEKNICIEFFGCPDESGTGNHFNSLESCVKTCHDWNPLEACKKQPSSPVFCEPKEVRYFYDGVRKTCESFSGCEPTGKEDANNFPSEEKCYLCKSYYENNRLDFCAELEAKEKITDIQKTAGQDRIGWVNSNGNIGSERNPALPMRNTNKSLDNPKIPIQNSIGWLNQGNIAVGRNPLDNPALPATNANMGNIAVGRNPMDNLALPARNANMGNMAVGRNPMDNLALPARNANMGNIAVGRNPMDNPALPVRNANMGNIAAGGNPTLSYQHINPINTNIDHIGSVPNDMLAIPPSGQKGKEVQAQKEVSPWLPETHIQGIKNRPWQHGLSLMNSNSGNLVHLETPFANRMYGIAPGGVGIRDEAESASKGKADSFWSGLLLGK